MDTAHEIAGDVAHGKAVMRAVVPVAEKYATSTLDIGISHHLKPCSQQADHGCKRM